MTSLEDYKGHQIYNTFQHPKEIKKSLSIREMEAKLEDNLEKGLITEKLYEKAHEELDILKGGEGSRGGKVIGHTKSGKPIYDSAGHESHKNFNSKDHWDAQEVHTKKFHELLEKHNPNNHDLTSVKNSGRSEVLKKHMKDSNLSKEHKIELENSRKSAEKHEVSGFGAKGKEENLKIRERLKKEKEEKGGSSKVDDIHAFVTHDDNQSDSDSDDEANEKSKNYNKAVKGLPKDVKSKIKKEFSNYDEHGDKAKTREAIKKHLDDHTDSMTSGIKN